MKANQLFKFYIKKSNIISNLHMRFYSKIDLTTEDNKIILPKIDDSSPIIGRTNAEQEYLYVKQPEMPENPKLLKLSVLGVPNSGKSTLVNRLMNRRISSVSSKINTTRNRLTAVLTNEDTQLIILDTPGLLSYKRHKKFNLDRQFLIDPHSSLWEADLVCVVHDVSDEFARNRIDREILKCLFANPEKESILILNKTDKLKNKNILLDLVTELTGGFLNGKEFISKEKHKKLFRSSQRSIKDLDYETMFRKTAEKLNIKLDESNSKKHKEILNLLDELRACEDYLIKNLEKINIKENEDSTKETSSIVSEDQRISIEKLKGDNLPTKLNPTNNLITSNQNQNSDLQLINSIVQSTPQNLNSPIPRRIEDIDPIEFKKDLMQTTDWHLYYKKLSALGVLVREKNYWPYFNQVFMISAKENDGVDDLKRYLFSRAQPGNWVFTRNLLTDQMPQEIAEMCVREKLLENFNNEVPYEVGIQTAYWEVGDDDCLNIAINILPGGKKSNLKRHMTVLLQDSGKYLKIVKEQARQDISNTFQCEVKLKLILIDSSQKFFQKK